MEKRKKVNILHSNNKTRGNNLYHLENSHQNTSLVMTE